MPLTPEEEKKLRQEIQQELERREQSLRENKQKEEEERRRRLEQRMREKIREEEEERFFREKGYVKYLNHQGLVEWLTAEEAERRQQVRRKKKSSSRHRKYQKKRLRQIIINSAIGVLAVMILLVLYKFNPGKGAEYGSIIVQSDVPGAQIYLDGMELHAFTPDTLRKISPGTHYLSVHKDGFTSYPPMAAISVAATKTAAINFSLKNAGFMGQVIIESNLSNFDLYIDGLPHKMTQSRVEVPIGYHVFSTVKTGYIASPSYQRVLVERDRSKSLRFQFNLEEEIGYLQISSNRQNEYIYLDNKFTGLKTTGRAFAVKAGTYEVSVRENGFISSPGSKLINLLPNERKILVFRSQAVEERQSVNIFSEMPGAAIIIDGAWTPFVTPVQGLRLSPGSHFINLMRGDSLFSHKDVLVDADKLNNENLKFTF